VSSSKEEVKDESLKEDEYELDIYKLLLYNFTESVQAPQMPALTIDLSNASDKKLAT